MTSLSALLPRRRDRFSSIRVRLTAWYVGVLAVTLVGYSTVLVLSLHRGLETGVDRVLSDAARHATAFLQSESDPNTIADEFRRMNAGTIVGIYDAADGRLLAGRPLPRAAVQARSSDPNAVMVQTVSLADGTQLRTWTQLAPQADAPDRILVVARSVTFIPIAIRELLLIVGITAPFTVLVAIVGGIFLAGRALNPIDAIARTADAISGDDLSRRLEMSSTHDEIGRLAATFNRMLDRLAAAFDRQRQFTADASHELRTPLATLVTRAGIALERDRAPADYRDVLHAIRDEGLHMGRVINDLLLLARADAGVVLTSPEQFDCADLVTSVGDTLNGLAETAGVRLNVVVEGPLMVFGDQTRLTQLLVNLVDNAIKFTPAGGWVEVRGSVRAGSVLLEVSDNGCGIAADELPRVFGRFYRAGADRGSERTGAGLGLSLCRAIAEAHAGTVELHSQLNRGTQAIVRLPLSADAPRPALQPIDRPRTAAAAD